MSIFAVRALAQAELVLCLPPIGSRAKHSACLKTTNVVRSPYNPLRTTKSPRFSKLELVIMEALWSKGQCSVREIHDSLPAVGRPAFTTLQTIVYRLEAKGALRCAKRVGNANVFEAVISRDTTERHLLDEVVRFFGGGLKGVMAHLIETGQLTLTDVEEAEKALRAAKRKKGASR